MKAAVIGKYGTADEFIVIDIPQPKIKEDEVLVKVYAASVNPIDWRLRMGQLKLIMRRKFPIVLGSDICGKIIKVGSKVKRFKENDEVFAMLRPLENGAYAEYVAVPEESLALKPKNMSYEEAAGVPLAALTAWQSLRDQGKIKAGCRVLINGSSGGVGTYAVQIAKALGAHVTAVCGSKGVELSKQLGADSVIDYSMADFTKTNETYDIIFDVVANSLYLECLPILAPYGVYMTTIPSVSNIIMTILTKPWSGRKAYIVLARPVGSDLEEIKTMIEAGKIKSIIDSIYPLDEVGNAHRKIEEHHAKGKIIIKIV